MSKEKYIYVINEPDLAELMCRMSEINKARHKVHLDSKLWDRLVGFITDIEDGKMVPNEAIFMRYLRDTWYRNLLGD